MAVASPLACRIIGHMIFKKIIILCACILGLGAIITLRPAPPAQSDRISTLPAPYCPVFVTWMGTDTLKTRMDNFYAPLFTPVGLTACYAKELVDRGVVTHNALDKFLMFNLGPRPDFTAFFLQYLVDAGYPQNHIHWQLARFYDEGNGAPQDKDKAIHLYREGLSFLTPQVKDQTECIQDQEKRTRKHMKREFASPLEKEQIQWFNDMCLMSHKDLITLGKHYMDESNPDYSVVLAYNIFSYIVITRTRGEAFDLYDKASDDYRTYALSR